MNHKTNRSEIPAVFRPWLLFLTLATLALVFLSPGPGGKERPRANKEFHVTIFPWMVAAEITISDGLDNFSGVSSGPMSDGQRSAMLIGLLLSLVVGPTLLLIGLRDWKSTPVPKRWHPPALLLGAVLVVSTTVPSVILAASQWQTFSTMQEAQKIARERDDMVSTLHHVGRDARQFRILPETLGGGGGTFQGYEIPATLKEDGQFRCEVSGANDTLITLVAVSKSGSGMQITGRMSVSGALRLDIREAKE